MLNRAMCFEEHPWQNRHYSGPCSLALIGPTLSTF